jgi:uncharacterized protein (TIGR03118 family)
MKLTSFFWKQRAAPDRQHCYRPVLECLEDRCLLSGGFAQVNLASDVPGLAAVTDPNLVNPWGAAFSPTGPFWFANNGSGVSDLLDGNGQPLPLVVAVPSAAQAGSTPTGTVFHSGTGFVISENGVSAPSRFLFATQDGTISGWTTLVDPNHALVAVDNSSSGADYTGLALAADPAGQSFLYAADFSHGTIDVFNQDFQPVALPGAFQDPNLPAGYVPFNIQNINNQLFVTYAQQNTNGHDDVAGAGHGFIDVYDTSGNLVNRFAAGGTLDSPWGLALAPADFGPFGGALLVGNNGDGHINAYDTHSGTFLGQLANDNGTPLAIPNLWALTFGNGHLGGDPNTLFFGAGVDYDAHGLFGAIQAPGRHGADTAGLGAFDPNAPGETGDYPLPPSAGPAFRVSSLDRTMPTSDLLSLTDSSLALVPTLSSLSSPAAGIDAPVTGIFSDGSTLSAAPSFDTIRLVPGAEPSPAAAGASRDVVALNAFLDLNALQMVPPKPVVAQQPVASLHTVDAARAAFADLDAAAENLLAEADVAELESPASTEQGPAALPPSSQAAGGIAALPSQSRAEADVQQAFGNESVETQLHGGWTNLRNLFFGVGIPAIWAYCVGQHIGFQQLRGKRARSDRTEKRPEPKP